MKWRGIQLEKEIPKSIELLTDKIRTARQDVGDFEKKDSNGIREKALIFCLGWAADLAEGCVVVVEKDLSPPLQVLTRGMLETLLWTNWIVQSEENAKVFSTAMVDELKRLTKKNLQAGYARIHRKSTGEDMTQAVLTRMRTEKKIPKRLTPEDIAKGSELEKLYTKMWGFESMYAHGKVMGLSFKNISEIEIFASASTANAYLRCTDLIVRNWIVERKATPKVALESALGI